MTQGALGPKAKGSPNPCWRKGGQCAQGAISSWKNDRHPARAHEATNSQGQQPPKTRSRRASGFPSSPGLANLRDFLEGFATHHPPVGGRGETGEGAGGLRAGA